MTLRRSAASLCGADKAEAAAERHAAKKKGSNGSCCLMYMETSKACTDIREVRQTYPKQSRLSWKVGIFASGWITTQASHSLQYANSVHLPSISWNFCRDLAAQFVAKWYRCLCLLQGKECHVMSCHVMPCHVMSCHAMSCHVMPCHAIPCHAISFNKGWVNQKTAMQ